MSLISGLAALDTNMLLLISRQTATSRAVLARYGVFSSLRAPIVSVIAMAELEGIAARHNWGSERLAWLQGLYLQLNVIPVEAGLIVAEFVSLDNYQRSIGKPIGKHDTWIAATAKVYEATLFTTDSDFRKLDPSYLSIVLLDSKSGKLLS